jgi:hypothetical protein
MIHYTYNLILQIPIPESIYEKLFNYGVLGTLACILIVVVVKLWEFIKKTFDDLKTQIVSLKTENIELRTQVFALHDKVLIILEKNQGILDKTQDVLDKNTNVMQTVLNNCKICDIQKTQKQQ